MSLWNELGYGMRSLTHRRQLRKRYDVINYFAHRRRARTLTSDSDMVVASPCFRSLLMVKT
jgi:hypothetical protein